jgi:hypothetical protein
MPFRFFDPVKQSASNTLRTILFTPRPISFVEPTDKKYNNHPHNKLKRRLSHSKANERDDGILNNRRSDRTRRTSLDGTNHNDVQRRIPPGRSGVPQLQGRRLRLLPTLVVPRPITPGDDGGGDGASARQQRRADDDLSRGGGGGGAGPRGGAGGRAWECYPTGCDGSGGEGPRLWQSEPVGFLMPKEG